MPRGVFGLFGAVFLLVGLGLWGAVAFVLGESLDKAENGRRVQGIVLEANDNQPPVVEFRTGDGQRIRLEGRISVSPTPYRVGETIGVFHDPQDPSDALIDAFAERWFLPLLFGGFAAAFSAIGLGFVLARWRAAAGRRRLLRHGLRFDGRIAGFEQARFTKLDGRRPWQALVTWTDAQGTAHSGHSEMLREDPAARFRLGDRVTVLVDRDDPGRVLVDLFGEANARAASGSDAGLSAKSRPKTGKTAKPPVVRRR
ncbi:MAG: DUF3592 domain-containing protein [Reyranellaceae bacterium]